MTESPSSVTLIYDGSCPFCSRYASYVRLKDAAGTVKLVNAREGGPEVDALWRDYDLDQGMAVLMGGRVYHGDDALHVLALLSSQSGFFNKLNYSLFSKPQVAKLVYPLLRAGRNLALLLKGEKQMKETRVSVNESRNPQ